MDLEVLVRRWLNVLHRPGANVAICSKSSEPHPTLPGTIHETAEIVEKAGGKALPIVLDVRDEDNINAAVKQTAEHFGGIDICVNNAGAFWIQPSMETTTKRHDLLFNINERAAFLVTRACHPYLVKSDNAHVLSLSPPLDLKSVWFQHTSPYSVSKYAMSLYALGWSKEFAEDGYCGEYTLAPGWCGNPCCGCSWRGRLA